MLNLQAVHSLDLPKEGNSVVFNIIVKQDFFYKKFFQILSKEDFLSKFFLESLQNKRQTEHYILFHRTSAKCAYEICAQKIIREFYENSIYAETMLGLNFAALMVELARTHQKSIEEESKKDLLNHDLSEIIQYMMEHYNTISLSSLSKHFSYSPTHLSMLIKKYSGSSFSDILQEIRFIKASELLQDTSLPVSEIMETVGYTNRSWFTRKFQERYGVTPSEYRKNMN